MLHWRRWLILITVTSTITGILPQRANVRLIRTKYVCENDVMHLNCEPPTVLEIHVADYGGAAASICQGTNQSCALIDKTDKVKYACGNKPSCSMTVMSRIFGDPCPGLNKYLNVIYACVKPINDTIPTTTPTTGIATTERITTTKGAMNLTTTANTTQPATTDEPTQRTTKKKTLTTRPGKKGIIRVLTFDPSNSVILESISNSARAMKLSVVGCFFWVCIIHGISVLWL